MKTILKPLTNPSIVKVCGCSGMRVLLRQSVAVSHVNDLVLLLKKGEILLRFCPCCGKAVEMEADGNCVTL